METNDTHILKRLLDLGEDRLGRLAEELLSNPRVADTFSTALQKAFEAKGRVDRNMQTVLGLLNLPSRADMTRLLTKLEAIQGSLVNLNVKVDRLLSTSGPPRRHERQRRQVALSTSDTDGGGPARVREEVAGDGRQVGERARVGGEQRHLGEHRRARRLDQRGERRLLARAERAQLRVARAKARRERPRG